MQKKPQTEFAYPVDAIHGKVSKHSRVIHSCTASGGQTTYLQGKRNLVEHPVSQDELDAQDLFTRRTKAVAARRKKTASTYAADMAAYRAQLNGDNPVKGFQAYLWSLVKAEIAE